MIGRLAPPVVVDVVRAALFCLGDAAESPNATEAWKPLLSLLERAGEPPKATLEHSVEALHTIGHVQLGKAGKPRLTEAGRSAATEWVGIRKRPPRAGWLLLSGEVLPARALGYSAQELHKKEKDRADWLRAEVVRQHFSLPLAPWSSPSAVRDAVGWRLLASGAPTDVIARAQGARGAFASGSILGALTCAYLRLRTIPKLEHVLSVLAEHATGAGALDATSLKSALGMRLLRRVPDSPAGGSAPEKAFASPLQGARNSAQAESAEWSPGDLATFAAKVVQAARRSKDGWLGDDMVFVSHTFRMFQAPDGSVSLAAFKRALLDAHRAGLLTLAGADMPQTLAPAELDESVVRHGATNFYFVRV